MRLIYIAFGWAAGILLAANNPGGMLLPMIWLALTVAAVIAALLMWRDSGLRAMAAALIAFTLGGLRMTLVPTGSSVAQYNNTGGLSLTGRVIAEPVMSDIQMQVRLNTETVTRAGQTSTTSGIVLVRAPRIATVQYGDRVSATGLLITPAELDTFSYADFLARSGVFSIMTDASLEVLEHSPASDPYPALLNFKALAGTQIARSLPEPQAALLTGILLGNESGIAPEIEEAFSRAGASHVIAISGFNMVILSGAVMGLLRRTPLSERWAALVGILAIMIYTVFVGAGAAVVRAALMSSLLVIGEAIKRRTYVPASLAFAAVLLSLINPTVLWDISFQLSFFATLGLVLYADPLSKRLDQLLRALFPRAFARSLGTLLAEPLVVTLAVQITTLPLIALYFSRLSLVSILTNLLIVPVQAGILTLGIFATVSSFFLPAVAQILYWYDLILLSWTTEIVRTLARLPFADVDFHVDPRLVTIYFAVLIGVALMQAVQPAWAVRLGQFLRQRAVTVSTGFAGFATVLLIGAVYLSRPDGNLHLWLLDMGHSNAVLLQTPGGAQILVDGGRFPSRLLTALGDHLPFNDREIEVIVMTQPDENEYGALTTVLGRYEAGIVLTNGQPNLSPAYIRLQEQLVNQNVLPVTAGYTLEVDDGVVLEVLHPAEQPSLEDSLDDSALVVRVTYGESSFLLSGDVSLVGQQAMLDAGRFHFHAAIFQLPRHGSARSLNEAFLAVVQPQIVLLQSDPANRSGDPSPDTLALVEGLQVYRTDTMGTIHLWSDGTSLWVETENPA